MDRLLCLLKEVQDSSPSKYECLTTDTGLKWSIKESKYNKFWEEYSVIVEEAARRDARLYLAETPQLYMPLNIVFRFKFLLSRKDEVQALDPFILHLCSTIQSAIEGCFEIDQQKSQRIGCLLETSDTTTIDSSFYYTYMRFHFPYCKTTADCQVSHFRPRLIEALQANAGHLQLPNPFHNDWNDAILIDPTQSLALYGSCESESSPIYSLSAVFRAEYDTTEIHDESTIDDEIFSIDMEEVFDISCHAHNATLEDGLQFHIEKHLLKPMFLSVHYYPNITNPKRMSPTLRIVQPSPARGPKMPVDQETEVRIAERFLIMMKQERFASIEYLEWIGKALYTVTNGTDEGLALWKHYTCKTGVFSPEKLESLYYTYNDNCVSLKTLAWYARLDSPTQYNDWHKMWRAKKFEDAYISCLHADVAEAVYRLFWLDFICTEKGDWWYFKGHSWFRTDSGIEIQKRLVDVIQVYMGLKDEFDKQFRLIQPNDPQSITIGAKIGQILALIKKLKTDQFIGSLIRRLKVMFHHERFLKAMDSSADLVGCTNGVIELVGNKALFRPGKPEDFITLSTGIPYRADFTKDHPLVKRLYHWIAQTFTDPELRHYVMKDFASFLKGKNMEKKLRTWTGEGDNSKSMWVKIFEKALGGYACKLPTSILEKRSGASSAQPELARTRSRHIAILQETDNEDKMNAGILKELTGGDSFFARSLFQEGGEVEATFKLILMCNKLPVISNADKAARNRLIIIPFLSQWVDEPPATEEEQFKMKKFKIDRDFESRIPEMAPALLWWMVHYYEAYKHEGLSVPKVVKEETEKYWQDNDLYQIFVKEFIIKAVDPDDPGKVDEKSIVSATEMYMEFKMWYKDSYPNTRIPDANMFKQQMNQRLGRSVDGRKWSGYRLKTMEIPEM